MLPGWQGLALAASGRGDWPDPVQLPGVSSWGAALMRTAGLRPTTTIVDARHRRQGRPAPPAGRIASGRISKGAPALGVPGGLQPGRASASLLTFNYVSFLLGVGSLALVAGLSVHEADHLVAAGLAGPDLQLGGPCWAYARRPGRGGRARRASCFLAAAWSRGRQTSP